MPIRIATVIREQREAKDLTQEKLAELVGTSTGFIGQVERGQAYPSVPVLAKLIDVLGVDANSLFYQDTRSYPYKEITIRTSRLSVEKQEFLLSIINLLEHSFTERENHEDSNM